MEFFFHSQRFIELLINLIIMKNDKIKNCINQMKKIFLLTI